MLRRLTFTLALLALGVAAALAAPIAGKVQSTATDTVVVKITCAKIDWVKKGINVKIQGGKGTIIAVGDSTVTIVTPKAKEMKADSTVTFEKAKAALTGC
jgi:hypothetical protein